MNDKPSTRVWCGLALMLSLMIATLNACCAAKPAEPIADPSATPAMTNVAERPLVGITSMFVPAGDPKNATFQVFVDYVDSVREAGGTPVMLPPIEDDQVLGHYVDRLDAVVLVGGLDVPPSAYGEETRPDARVVEIPPRRFKAESAFVERWLKTSKPLLGVCLGAQLTNVVKGGTLIQDIPTQVGRDVAHRTSEGATHPVHIEKDSMLARLLKTDKTVVNSYHHQAVKQPGKGLRIVARSPDGVAEAMELNDREFGLFVQWHPERMDDPQHRKAIFSALIEAARNQANPSKRQPASAQP